MARYCECLRAGRECTSLCCCEECFNRDERPERKKALEFLKNKREKRALRSNVILLHCLHRRNLPHRCAVVNAKTVSARRSTVFVLPAEENAVLHVVV